MEVLVFAVSANSADYYNRRSAGLEIKGDPVALDTSQVTVS